MECLRRDLSPFLCYSNKQCQWDGILPLTNLHGCQRSESQFKGTSFMCWRKGLGPATQRRFDFLANMYKKFGWEEWVFKAATFPKHMIFPSLRISVPSKRMKKVHFQKYECPMILKCQIKKHLDLGLPSNINLKISVICNNLLQKKKSLN